MPRSRSRSPYRSSRHHSSSHQPHSHYRSRSPSPHRNKDSRRRKERQHSDKHREPAKDPASSRAFRPLPFDAASLSKHDLSSYHSMFGLYLDIQKGLDIEDLPDDEVKGRWKSFVKKWNAGDLAHGWYDPTTLEKATRGTFGEQEASQRESGPRAATLDHNNTKKDNRISPQSDEDTEGNDADEYGPRLPASMAKASTDEEYENAHRARPGPSIPTASDIRMRNELDAEDAAVQRDEQLSSIRDSRKLDRKLQRDRLDELVPRAEAGSRERQLEKKRDTAASNRAFASAKDAGGDVELRDADVMGDEDSLRELKRMKDNEQRKKNERELRREEIVRARMAEREERLRGMREKEAKTMDMLKALAKSRFGENG